MLNVLVTVATKHGSTLEIAERIASTIAHAIDADVDVVEIDQLTSVDRYDAIVLGSAVYMGRWLSVARRFVDEHGDELTTRPVWLFSSGPIGEPPQPEEDPADVPELIRITRAREHRTFPGNLQRHGLGFAERAMVRALRAPDGDFRDFTAVAAWATDIATALNDLTSDTAKRANT